VQVVTCIKNSVTYFMFVFCKLIKIISGVNAKCVKICSLVPVQHKVYNNVYIVTSILLFCLVCMKTNI
jgi:hypothetical protein